MITVSGFRMYVLRGMYLVIVAGLTLSIGPHFIQSIGRTADSYTVVNAFLFAMTLLALLGLFQPLKCLPILFFEILWKSSWLLFYALPMYLNASLDDYSRSVAIACLMGIVLTPLAVPWCYVAEQYFGFTFGEQKNESEK